MPYVGLTNIGANINVDDVAVVPKHDIGAVTIVNGNEYMYIRATAAIAVGDALIVDTGSTFEPFGLTPATALNQSVEAIAVVAIPSGSHGWVCTRGNVVAKVAASTAANVSVGSSATAGTLTTITISASPTQAEVQRVLAAASSRAVITLDAESGGLAEVQIK